MAQTVNVKIGDGNTHAGNITGAFNSIIQKSDEDAQIMRRLSPLKPQNRHQSIRADRFDGVGDWLLETREFREWREGEGGAEKAVLFCSGNPGVGKTYLSSLVIDSLCDQAGNAHIAVLVLYCDYLVQQEQTIANTMGSILKQLLGRGDIPAYLREAFHKGKRELGGRRLRVPDLMEMLRAAIASLPQVFICIDALDEYLPKQLPELLGSLRDIVRESPKTRIFLTGRPHVREDVQRHFPNAAVVSIIPATNDIRSYLEMRLDGDVDPEAMNDDLRADIIKVILEKTSDIFLLVSLGIDAILGEVTIRQRRKKLEEITRGNGLSDAYTETLTRMKAQKGNRAILGLKTLMWVSHSERPLRAAELCHALGVEIGSSDLEPENVPAIRTLLASCLGLITVEASTSVVRLVHFTLQEHLSSVPTLSYNPHSIIAEVCLTYLNFKRVRDLSPTLRTAPSTTPFLKYASYYWGDHARRGMTENVKALALGLLNIFNEHISAQLLLLRYNKDRDSCPYFDAVGGRTGFTKLHAVAFLGIVEAFGAVMEMDEWDVNASDSMRSTALRLAAVRGHGKVVKLLLQRGDVAPDRADIEYGRTPLSWAAEEGHDGVVRVFLERGDVNPDQADRNYGRTPLSWAAGGGHEGVVKMLLEREGVNPDHVDTEYGKTPLSWAAHFGHEGVAKMLLEPEGVNPDHVDTKYGKTPLSWAAHFGHEGVVKMLLEREGVNPDHVDTKYGKTPLSWAAEHGHGEVVKILLAREDVNPNMVAARYGQTPLSWAARRGHEVVVNILLEREGVNPDQADTKYGQTPLSWAAKHGHEGVVKILLGRADVNPDRTDTRYRQTPISWAAKHGREGVVRMLLECDDVNPNTVDTRFGQTPLSWAAEGGHEEIVKLLLEREDVNPDLADNKYGRTPLWWATLCGNEGVVKMLLERGDVTPIRRIPHLAGNLSRAPPGTGKW